VGREALYSEFLDLAPSEFSPTGQGLGFLAMGGRQGYR